MKYVLQKKQIILAITTLLLVSLLAGCTSTKEKADSAEDNEENYTITYDEDDETEFELQDYTDYTTPIDLTPPELSIKDAIIGQWYYQNFHEEDLFSYAQSLEFYADGTGTLTKTYYVPKSEVESLKDLVDAGVGLPNLDASAKFTWTIDDSKIVHASLQTGDKATFTFSEDAQSLIVNNNTSQMYSRSKSNTLNNYMERSLFSLDAQKEAIQRSLYNKIIGNWYFDVFVWNFGEEGRGYLDIPKLGETPAESRKFSYTLTRSIVDNDDNIDLTIDWDDGRVSYFAVIFETDGSITLENLSPDKTTVTLTRKFEIGNCPVSTAIIQNNMNVVTGSIFDDIL